MYQNKIYDFQKGEILLVNKPLGWSSFDVVKKIRNHLKKKLQVKNIKVGHTGTLDPLATGLLIICTGKKTKEIDLLMNENKTYEGVIKLGATTPSFDLETAIDVHYPVEIDKEKVIKVNQLFLGEQLQEPPMFSAKRINGKRAYEFARKGEKVRLKKSKIVIDKLLLDILDNNCLKFEINCSKGTYIRSLARDISKALNTGGHLIKLRRIRSGNFDLDQALSIDDWLKIIESM